MRKRGWSLIDRVSRVYPVTPFLLWMPLVVWLLYRSIDADQVSPWGMALMAVAALVAWTFAEYMDLRRIHGGTRTSTETAHRRVMRGTLG